MTDKLMKKLEKLLREKRKELKPHKIEITPFLHYECWVLERAIVDLRSMLVIMGVEDEKKEN